MTLPKSPPTHVRYYIVALTTFVAMLLYLDRICLSQAEMYVREDLGLTVPEMGWAMSAFFWAYALGQVPGGWLADRYGPRLMLTIYLAMWSTFTGLVGLAQTLAMLVFFRLMIGIFEAGAYPACAGLIQHWVPQNQRGLASGIVSLGGRFGNSVGAFATALLIGFFVASDVSPRFEDHDILETKLLSRAFVEGPRTPAGVLGERVMAAMPNDTVAEIRAVAIHNQTPKLDSDAMIALSPEVRKALVDRFNQLLGQPDLAEPLRPLADLLPKSLRGRLYEVPQTVAQTERANRMLLEGVYPDSVRKLLGPGWRPTMIVYGLVGVLVAGFFWWYFRDRPEMHWQVNAGECALIKGLPSWPPLSVGGASANPEPTLAPNIRLADESFPLVRILTSFSMWMNSLLQFSTNLAWIFLMTWFPKLLVDLKVSLDERGLMTAVVFLVGLPCLIIGGRLTDWLTMRLGKRWGRALPMGLTRFISAGAFLVCLTTRDPWVITIAMCVVQLGTDLGLPALWGYCLDVGGKHTGAVLGWGNMFGNFGAALSPLVLAPFVQDKEWETVFRICAGSFVVAGFAGLLIDARKPISKQAGALG